MRNKGFTLIELLAVIVILAIIALIATPVILNIIEDARKSTNEQSINLYGKAVENAIANYMINNPSKTIPSGSYTQSNGGKILKGVQTLTIDYDGNKVECGTITIKEEGSVYLANCKVNDVDVVYTYGEIYMSPCILTDDNSNKVIDIGDEVTCGTESFYVVPNDITAHPTAVEGTVSLIAKYNLEVGNCYDCDGSGDISAIENPTGIQSSKARGDASYPNYGVIQFAYSEYWESDVADGTFIYNSNSSLYPHVENYGTYMRGLGVDVKESSLLSLTQLSQEETLIQKLNFASFWLGSVETYGDVYAVGSSLGSLIYEASFVGDYLGVRPVIIIPESDIKYN